MIPEYVERVLNWPTPTTVRELNTFLGFSGYYRSYIPEYAKLTVRLNALKRQTKLEWNDTLEKDFQELKSAFRAECCIKPRTEKRDSSEPGEGSVMAEK